MLPKHDFHVHTKYSDGVSPPAEMVEAASKKGLEAVAISDHGPELSVGIKRGQIRQMIEDVKMAKSDSDLPVLIGMEANIVDMSGNIDLEGAVLSELDLLLAGVHYLPSSRTSPEATARNYLRTVLNLVENRDVDILAHPFWYYDDLTSHLSSERLREFAGAASANNVAVELNRKHRVLTKKFLQICRDHDVRFSFGTDAHRPSDVGKVGWAEDMLEELGLGRDSLLFDELV